MAPAVTVDPLDPSAQPAGLVTREDEEQADLVCLPVVLPPGLIQALAQQIDRDW